MGAVDGGATLSVTSIRLASLASFCDSFRRAFSANFSDWELRITWGAQIPGRESSIHREGLNRCHYYRNECFTAQPCGCYCSSIGAVLVQYWCRIGVLLVQHRCSIGAVFKIERPPQGTLHYQSTTFSPRSRAACRRPRPARPNRRAAPP